MDLLQRVGAGEGEFLLFAITPPRASTGPERMRAIAEKTLDRLRSVDPDGVLLYDVAEEGDRNPDQRPFPFLPTVDPATYLAEHFGGWPHPVVVYRSVGKYSEASLEEWLQTQPPDRVLSVLVGSSSSRSTGLTSLRQAYALRETVQPDLKIGAVVIPERHAARGDEHRRMIDKQAAGCSFFVSQILYDVNAAKNLVSDYRDECDARSIRPRPIAFTLSVCGSAKTLEFLTWLGVQVPPWIQRDLTRSKDTLESSYDHARAVAHDMLAYCRRLDIPVGLNVESVSSRRSEIEAAVQLAIELRSALRR
ncbi:methylenetetrahydrofolate reductase [Microlunatus speluncae]|uniref:methylenetetrahydrofolate reductase n=1 Tax=Microlunatus speluncae TaxID=2594267 RepID=UPI0012663C7B|nr:methylenetetrahydrofolate reductase [Microlunatus speluncae]